MLRPTPPEKTKPVGQCPKPWKDKRFCDRMGDRCKDESECFGNFRCCFNGCQKDCVKPGNMGIINDRELALFNSGQPGSTEIC